MTKPAPVTVPAHGVDEDGSVVKIEVNVVRRELLRVGLRSLIAPVGEVVGKVRMVRSAVIGMPIPKRVR